MARQVNHTALDHLIADEHKHQPYLVSLLDSPTLLDEPWKPTSTTGMDVMSEMVRCYHSAAERLLTRFCSCSRSHRCFIRNVLSSVARIFAFALTRLTYGSVVQILCFALDTASSPLATRTKVGC